MCVRSADRASGSWPRQDPRGKVSCEGKAGHSYQPNPTENQIVVELRLSTWPWMGRRRKKQTKPLWTQILYLASAPELLVSWATSNQVCESAPGSQGMPPKKNTWEVLQQVEPPEAHELYSPSRLWLKTPKSWVSQMTQGPYQLHASAVPLPTMNDPVPSLRNSTSILCLRICTMLHLFCHYIPCVWPCLTRGECKEGRKEGKRGERSKKGSRWAHWHYHRCKQLARNVVRI